jgi:hypothetical protein
MVFNMESIVLRLPKDMNAISINKRSGILKIQTNDLWKALQYMENKYDLAYIDKYTVNEISFKIRYQFKNETKACLVILSK